MTMMPVNIPKIWSKLNETNQEHALTYMEFLYHQQRESEKKPNPLPYNMLKGKMVIPEGVDDPIPEFEEYQQFGYREHEGHFYAQMEDKMSTERIRPCVP